MPVIQTKFDQAFIEVIEYLVQHRQQHKKFRYQKDLLLHFGINHKSWSPIKLGQRHVPADRVDKVKKILVKEYQVSETFLKTYTGKMFSPQADWSKNALTKQEIIAALTNEIEDLRKQLTRAKSRAKKQKTDV